MRQIVIGSARRWARIAGVFEALEGVTSSFGQVVVLGRLVVSGNAAATAANILGQEQLFWLGFVSSLLGVVFHVVWVFLFYGLFKPVNSSLSLLALLFGLLVCAMQAVTSLLYVAPLLVLQAGPALSGLGPDGSQVLAYAFLKLNSYAFATDLVFFGVWCVLTGYLILRSTFVPRILGVLLAIDGLGWATYLYPPFAYSIFPFIATAAVLAEMPLQLWLIVFGVNEQRWSERASTAT